MNKDMKLKERQPPKIARWLLFHTLNKNERDFVLGDFEELYVEIRNKKDVFKASIWYWTQVWKSIPHFIYNFICVKGNGE